MGTEPICQCCGQRLSADASDHNNVGDSRHLQKILEDTSATSSALMRKMEEMIHLLRSQGSHENGFRAVSPAASMLSEEVRVTKTEVLFENAPQDTDRPRVMEPRRSEPVLVHTSTVATMSEGKPAWLRQQEKEKMEQRVDSASMFLIILNTIFLGIEA